MARRQLVAALLTALLSSCAAYHPAPLSNASPDSAAASYTRRSLTDSALARSLADAGRPLTDTAWDVDQLALAAIYFRSEIPLARAMIAEAQASQITAGVRPAPSVEASVSRTARPIDQSTHTSWSESITAGLTLELGGKRSARIARAKAATLAAQLRLASTIADVAYDTRSAAVTVQAVDDDAFDATRETHALRTVARLLQARYDAGQLSAAEVARAQSDGRTADLARVDAQRARVDARLALAHALGVPLDALDNLAIRAPAASGCQGVVRRLRDSLAAVALRRRPDVGAVLADYASAEIDVRLEVARQYPDLTLGPGLLWDQGIPGWVLNVGLPALLTGRNRGSIAEAEARRTEAAARARVLQDGVVAAVDSAVNACANLHAAGDAADSLLTTTEHEFHIAQVAYGRGEIGETEVALSELALVRAGHTRRVTQRRAVVAGEALMRATGGWSPAP